MLDMREKVSDRLSVYGGTATVRRIHAWLRMRASGLRNVVVPSAHIWHKISVTMGGADSPRKVYHKTRSHLLLAHLHAPRSFPILLKGLLRDFAWLLVKSSDRERFRKARAYVTAVKDYARGRTGREPDWLWQDG